ncbi:MAG: PQQ-binding-like beta-propeller repeat protein [Solirubrobacteraceae bacterium]
MIPSPRRVQTPARLALGVVVFVLVAAPLVLGREGDVSNSDVTFVATTDNAPTTATARAGKNSHPADDAFEWPVYGFKKARTHHLPLSVTPRPPYHQAWAYRSNVLLEFAPVLCGRKIFLMKNNGALYALSRRTGKPRWKRKLGALAATSPACSHGVVYAVVLQRTRGSKGGRVLAVTAKSGRTLWSRKLPSRAESSPLLDRGKLYFGTENGTVYALRARTGRVVWTYRAGDAVKGALALDAGKLYFGDYGGRVHAIRRSNGTRVWRVTPSSGPLGLSEGNFYSSAAVAYGRVYVGSTNGNVYSFSSADGRLAWRKRTGGYVYASPAVGRAGGGPPTVYIGSYDGRFYALHARSGRPRWVRSLGDKISGAATIVGDLVFVSDLDKRTTWALGAQKGTTVWKTRRGGFNPVISDGRRIYFAGYTSLFALDHADRPFDGRAARSAPSPGTTSAQRRAARSSRRRAVTARRARAARNARAARRVRADRRAKARSARRHKLRSAPHGHRHVRRRGKPPPRCHRHRHVYAVRGKTIVLVHDHCHTHVRRR